MHQPRGFYFFPFLALVLAAAVTIGHLKNQFEYSFSSSPYGWLDEGFVLGPALNIYDKDFFEGYLSFRCRENIPAACYGSTQVFLDALTLRVLPAEWLRQNPLLKNPGTSWFYMTEYPNAFRALRISRALFSCLLVVLLMSIGLLLRKRSFPAVYAFLLSLGIGSFACWRVSHLGIKNDVLSALWLVMFMLLSFYSLNLSQQRRSSRIYILTIIWGVLAMGVKFTVLLPLVAFVGFDTWIHQNLKRLGLALLTGVATYILLNPNIFANSTEASWFFTFFTVAGKNFDSQLFKKEIFNYAIPNAWPILVGFVLAIQVIREKKIKNSLSHLYLILVPCVLIFLTIKAVWFREAYYLPVLVWSLGSIPLLWVEVKSERIKNGSLILLALGWFLMSVISEPSLKDRFHIYQNMFKPISWESGRHGLDQAINTTISEAKIPAQSVVYADLFLRPGLSENIFKNFKIHYFDSLSESPADVISNDGWIMVTCWGVPSTQDEVPLVFQSETAKSWAEATAQVCQDKIFPQESAIYAFQNGFQPPHYWVGPVSLLLKNGYKNNFVYKYLNPRFMKGAIEGIDYWYARLVLYKDTTLQSKVTLKKHVQKIVFPMESTCKNQGQITVQLVSSKERINKMVSMDIRDNLCQKRPWVCALKMDGWWMERLPVEVSLHELPFRAGDIVEIILEASHLNISRCRISLHDIVFE